MLHDPQHDLTLQAFRDFAATKDPQERFPYHSLDDCACAQFAEHIGLWSDWRHVSLDQNHLKWQAFNVYVSNARCSMQDDNPTWGNLLRVLDRELSSSA